LGSTVNLTTTSGGVQSSYSLDPWGHIRRQSGLSVNRHIFTGQEHDTNTGLIYFGARYYDPDTARFISQDSYLGESNVPPSLNRYLYAYSNPLVYVDLLGYASTMDSVTDYLNGIAEADRQEVIELNKDFKQQTYEVQQDRRSTMSGKAVKSGLVRFSAGVIDTLGSSVDVEVAATPGFENTKLSEEAGKRLDETNEAAVKTGQALKQIAAKLTTEERSAMIDSAKVSINNSLHKIFVEGDLVAGYDFISGTTEAVAGLAAAGMGTAGRVRQAGKTTVEIAEEMTVTAKNAKTVEAVAARSEAAASMKGETGAKEVSYVLNDEGLTIQAEGVITGSHPGRGKGYRPEPVGGRLPGDHRGHMIPEGGVDKPALVNVKENIISESATSNLGPKKSFDNLVSRTAADNPNSVIRVIAEPLRAPGEIRPHAVTYWIEKDGVKTFGQTIFNLWGLIERIPRCLHRGLAPCLS
jgi:RHS repeat-associated protein